MAGSDKVVVGCSHGDEDPDNVVVSYLTAGAALDQGKDVVMWLTSEGVRLALTGYADPIRAGVRRTFNPYPRTQTPGRHSQRPPSQA